MRCGQAGTAGGCIRGTLLIFTFIGLLTRPGMAQDIPKATAPETAGKAAVPDAAAKQDAFKVVNQVYKDDLAKAKNAKDKSDLAKKMFRSGVETTNEAANQFVQLSMAKDIAAEAGDAETSLAALAAIARTFQVDGLAMKLQTFRTLSTSLTLAEDLMVFAEQVNPIIDEAIAQDRYDLATQFAVVGATSAQASQNADLTRQANERISEIKEVQAVHAQAKKALELGQAPDAAATLIVGKYQCFFKGEWTMGLQLFARGNDTRLRALAENDLKNPSEALDKMKVGDDWWEFGGGQSGVVRAQVKKRAAKWYMEALPALSGLQKIRVEKRVDEVTNPLGKRKAQVTVFCDDLFIMCVNGKRIGESRALCSTETFAREFRRNDVITVRAENTGWADGFACIIQFDDGHTLETSRNGPWRAYEPSSAEMWWSLDKARKNSKGDRLGSNGTKLKLGMTEVGTIWPEGGRMIVYYALLVPEK